jgi:zinc transport system permease protein
LLQFIDAFTSYDFLAYALIGGFLSALSCGVVGSYVVARRLTYLAGAIAHCVLAGLGGARFLQVKFALVWLEPIYGAVAAALLAAWLIGWMSLKQREDSIIGALWACGMAGGVLFLAATPGYETDLMNYLFGNILLLSARDLWIMAGLDGLVLLLGLGFYPQLLAVCYDEEFARLRGLNTKFYYLLLLAITALTVVVLSTMVGLILVMAFLCLPAALAGLFVRRLINIIWLATAVCMGFVFCGLFVSYQIDASSGAVTVLIAGGVYFSCLAALKCKKKWFPPVCL